MGKDISLWTWIVDIDIGTICIWVGVSIYGHGCINNIQFVPKT